VSGDSFDDEEGNALNWRRVQSSGGVIWVNVRNKVVLKPDSQPYALVVTFSFDGEEFDLYNLVRQRVRIRERVRVQN